MLESSKSDQSGSLVLVSRDRESFVSSMNLPEYNMDARFPNRVGKAPK